MTTNELHDILDDEELKLSVNELKEIIYQLKNDCILQLPCSNQYGAGYYAGEINAFYLVLDLMEHLEG